MIIHYLRRKKMVVCKCNMCGEVFRTEKKHDKYICMDCAEKLERGGLSRQKRVLVKQWKKQNIVYL